VSILYQTECVRIFYTYLGFTTKQTVDAFQPIGTLCQKESYATQTCIRSLCQLQTLAIQQINASIVNKQALLINSQNGKLDEQ
jgi:hypothetical protein